ncbi:MAG: sedoheptulose-7-phosphate:D-glyceraldehyde-3-phosphate transaldolase [Tremellales sp. Tagirdzhanova-0007]|nr:MAG: sedoheptulose-7-phosphate:D-glyceraldehyde-3-phosphate transaldolase [Tremellales sp. Tagirdzhanova-0007]
MHIYKPQDATTNPSLILAASKLPAYAKLVDSAIQFAKKKGGDLDHQSENAMDALLTQFGSEILKIVPGRVSTEVDAKFSFDTEKTINKAHQIIDLYKDMGISKERVLVKMASTYQGIKAAEQLEKEGIQRAVACAEANVTLISPFCGRILDWYKKKTGQQYASADDPGVKSVQKIFKRQHGYKTIIMGASFRDVGAIKELAGCDYLTISPKLLEELNNSDEPVPKRLEAESAHNAKTDKVSYLHDEAKFLFDTFDDEMAFDKLHEGIRGFAKDGATLKEVLKGKLQE